MVTKTVLGIVCAVATGVLLFTVAHLQHIHHDVEALVQSWEAEGPQTTALGRLRAVVAAMNWLGPLRPAAPRDPLKECGLPPAGYAWWYTRRHLACLQEHMAEARAEQSLFERKLLAIIMITVNLLAFVVLLLAKVQQNVPGDSLSRGVLLKYARLLAKDRQPLSKSLKRTPRVWRLKDAMRAALSRRRRKNAGKKVSYDSLDWWREHDDGRGKLVIQPKERIGEKFRPYPYPKPPGPLKLPTPIGDLPFPHQGCQCACAAESRWWLVLLAATLLLQLHLCFR
ncbi:uncharacterized protein LOC126983557 isoform X2 [Eriocheir sinensis]|uniref:uncharacterized protein LOC126983557 isoform X2 n=1 Tax=Eriocheir sinensis TaxID=95602 RepID=UPI0021C9C11A|nr:uncharacterized protein LOC126983557 isoform X2 [Eriocheir sinensis]